MVPRVRLKTTVMKMFLLAACAIAAAAAVAVNDDDKKCSQITNKTECTTGLHHYR